MSARVSRAWAILALPVISIVLSVIVGSLVIIFSQWLVSGELQPGLAFDAYTSLVSGSFGADRSGHERGIRVEGEAGLQLAAHQPLREDDDERADDDRQDDRDDRQREDGPRAAHTSAHATSPVSSLAVSPLDVPSSPARPPVAMSRPTSFLSAVRPSRRPTSRPR